MRVCVTTAYGANATLDALFVVGVELLQREQALVLVESFRHEILRSNKLLLLSRPTPHSTSALARALTATLLARHDNVIVLVSAVLATLAFHVMLRVTFAVVTLLR